MQSLATGPWLMGMVSASTVGGDAGWCCGHACSGRAERSPSHPAVQVDGGGGCAVKADVLQERCVRSCDILVCAVCGGDVRMHGQERGVVGGW